MNHKIDRDTYIIPPNFIESGTFFGGMFKARNVIEAGILAFAIGVPVFSLLPLGLTARIIALCLTALPAALVALIGVSGESLSSFLLIFIKYLRNRRIVGGNSAEDAVPAAEHGGKHIKKKVHKPDKAPRRSRRSGREDFPAEFDEVRGYEIRQKLRPVKKQKPAKEKKTAKQKKKVSKERKVKRPIRTQEPKPACLNPVADYLPISKIENGIIYTKDHRYVKVVEVVPINFMLRSAQEQRNIIYSFVSYLKISPIKLQIKVLTRRAEINRHLDTVRKEMEQETNEQCLLMQEDYLQFVQQIGSREAITRRFFLIFEYEPWSNTKRSDEEGEAINALQSAVHTATNYLRQCGNEVIVPENWDEFTVDVLYNLLCRNESAVKPLSVRAQEVVAEYLAKGRDSEIDHIPATEFCAPKSIDFTHGHHICIDGLYYAYLLVPSDGYKTQVPAGWLSLIVNAGDGIDMDMFLSRQPKETIIQKVGQQLRINRSKIKDASDTNTDFDDIDGAIRSGYFLKEGLANNEDFYYLNLLITITASNEEDLEWKVSEMKKLLLSQDMNACTCHFREEQAFLSALPLVAMEKKLYERGMLRQNKILGNMLGADIDFIVRGIDSKTRSVVASRKEAMLRKRQIFYLDTDATGMYRVYEGRIVQARVIAVAEKVVRVEVFGVETSILARDLAWDWIGDAHERFSVGDEVLVRILSVRRNSLEDLGIKADIKSISENTDRDNLQKCRIQGKYAGRVTDVHKGVVYVRLSNGVNAVAHSCYDYRMPGKKDDVSFAVTRLDMERGVAVGIITRIIRQNL